MKKHPTLKEIAKELGVSVGTLDRALHDRYGIRQKTKERVLERIEELGYKPDRTAQMLSKRYNRKTIGVILLKEPAFYWDAMRVGIATAAKELADYGIDVVYRDINVVYKDVHEADLDYGNALDELTEGGAIDALAIKPFSYPQLLNRLKSVHETGIPIAAINDYMEEIDFLFYVGPHPRLSGRLAASLLCERLNRSDGILLLKYNTPVSKDYNERYIGFMEYIEENCPDIRVIERVYELCDYLSSGYLSYSDYMELKIRPVIEELILSSGGFLGMYILDGATLPVVADIKKKNPILRSMRLVGHELNSAASESITDGTIDAIVYQDPYAQGYYAIRALGRYLTDGTVPPCKKMFTRLDIITKENYILDEHIINPYL